MNFLRRRAIWAAAAVSVLAFASGGAAAAVRDAATAGPGRATVHQAVDHDAVLAARPQADRSPLDVRPDQSKLLLLAWFGVLLGAALVARAAVRAIEIGARRVGSTVSTRQRFDRGPPAPRFA